MSQVYSFAFGVPFCQKNEGEQTTSSIALRVMAVSMGIIAIIIGSLIIVRNTEFAHLNTAYGWSILTLGVALVLVGISIKYIKRMDTKVNVHPDPNKILNNNIEHAYSDPVSASRNPFTPPNSVSSSYQIQQRQKIEEDLAAKLNLETKRQKQIDWCEKTNREEEQKLQVAVAKLKEKNLPESTEKKEIERLTNKYKRDQERRKEQLDRYLLELANAQESSKQITKILNA